MMGDSDMGAYGTPEHLPPLKQTENLKWVCRACKMEFRGNYCPFCGTKAGKSKYWWVFRRGIIFLFGALTGIFFVLLGIFLAIVYSKH